MDIKEETNKKIEELQILENQLQNFIAQKQSIEIEISETDNALHELKNSNGEIYKIISNVMVRASKEKLIKDLEEKKKLTEMKINSIEKQEKLLEKNLSDLREEVNREISRQK